MTDIADFDTDKFINAVEDCARICGAVQKFCVANGIHDEEIEVSIYEVICGRSFGLTADEVLGPVSPAYLKAVLNHANRVQL